ncbi:hypothetical protein [Lutispora thermophila]|uniref:Uncharacterized protein n=1 Tax=Lutispora thermophila DSM 19022 TaxID=1122184 RepID=A0A1M6DBC9_9FIRM|nr:hypothetical protein [Lutispora thermophila]SHI70469.1 hypothetical protein SAMN02745176_01104 [Lutispora thermophila DSM 19022]
MEEKQTINIDHSDPLLRDIKILIDLLNPLVSSYRLLVGAADEFNRITLAHKSDLEGAINRADDMGDIIDEVNDMLKTLIKTLVKKIESDYACDKDFKHKS